MSPTAVTALPVACWAFAGEAAKRTAARLTPTHVAITFIGRSLSEWAGRECTPLANIEAHLGDRNGTLVHLAKFLSAWLTWMMKNTARLAGVLCCAWCAHAALGQELEPRAYSPSPVGVNFSLLAYAHSTGEVLTDPSVPIQDVEAKLNAGVA